MMLTNLSPDCLGTIVIVTGVLFVAVSLILANSQQYVAASRPAVPSQETHHTIDE